MEFRSAIMSVPRNRRRLRRYFPLELFGHHQWRGIDGAYFLQLRFNQNLEGIEPDAVDEYLDTGHHTVLAERFGIVEHRPDSQGQPQVVCLWAEIVQGFGQAGPNVVLVSADSLELVARAYPNFFMDSRAFLAEVNRVLQS